MCSIADVACAGLSQIFEKLFLPIAKKKLHTMNSFICLRYDYQSNWYPRCYFNLRQEVKILK